MQKQQQIEEGIEHGHTIILLVFLLRIFCWYFWKENLNVTL